jgi:signal peptidase I
MTSDDPTPPEPDPRVPIPGEPDLGADATTVSRSSRRNRRRHSGTRQAIEWVLLIAGALAIALIVKAFLFQAFYIPSASMDPTLKINDRVLVNKLSYKLHDVHRGDIVVFEKPPNEASNIKDLVKRVIALPGESVEGRGGHVWVNGRELDESYLRDSVTTSRFPKRKVPDGYVWVMGDNRPDSQDSRFFGPIKESSIVGRVFVRIWPVTRLGFL